MEPTTNPVTAVVAGNAAGLTIYNSAVQAVATRLHMKPARLLARVAQVLPGQVEQAMWLGICDGYSVVRPESVATVVAFFADQPLTPFDFKERMSEPNVRWSHAMNIIGAVETVFKIRHLLEEQVDILLGARDVARPRAGRARRCAQSCAALPRPCRRRAPRA